MGCALGASLQEHIQTSKLYFCWSAISLFPEDKVQDSRHEYLLVTLDVTAGVPEQSIKGILLFPFSLKHKCHSSSFNHY